MARFDRMTVYSTMMNDGVLPLFNSPDIATVKGVVATLVRGGSHVMEYTNRGDFAMNVFTELIQHTTKTYPDIILGVGTVEDAPTAAAYIAQGANFILAPNFNPEVARLCNRRKVAYVPGCGSVSEISNAEELGAEIVKLFPADALGGPDFVKAILGPRPWTRILPTGGVSPDEANLRAWFDAGAACVGMGSKLIRADWLKEGNFAAMEVLVRDTLALIKTIRSEKQAK
ncbi:MAG: bifunctional 4-hydroxy-2-oxoglutarate aldolase/2-dehydro-3-deoxy-phosphogluconate aldolase [Anaerolineaceae bacterium]|nr:bifunctional 4-hydroxy-2-oxoglutarate aldolase/2-dehydro-3-deoxy-phosphogluconate aldolase [Anaerolineaceae bacterium]